VGQPANAQFWLTPGTTLRDAKGNITYTEIKDPKTFTMKVFDHGQWLTYRYEPNSSRIAKVEAPDTTEDYLYDGDQWNGLTLHAGGRAHTIHSSGSTVEADNMPPVTIERDDRGRDIAVRRGADVVAAISYDTSGQVQRLTLGAMTLDFAMQNNGVVETLAANGKLLVTRVAHPEAKHPLPVSLSLDPVMDRLGLSPEWRNSVRVRHNATGAFLSVSNGQSGLVAEIVQFGAMSAAFDAKGSPLFYDLALRYSARLPAIVGGDTAGDVTTALNGVVPNHLIVPTTGNASAYVQAPGDGAISSIWTLSAGGVPSFRFRVYHESGRAGAASRALHPASTSVSDMFAVPDRRFTPLMIWQCGSYEYWTCDSSGYSGYCGNEYEPQYCDTGGGGGGYTPPPDDTGGAPGGGTGTGNQVTGDPDLRMKVNAALNSAYTKFRNTRCSQDLFNDTKLTDGSTSLASVLAQRGTDAATWLNSLTFVNGGSSGTCATAPAWTLVNGTTVDVCTSFKTYGSTAGAVLVIHEELHTLGLTEKPQYPDAARTSGEITDLVMQYCGG
jgi:hypothetical protein